MALSWKLQLTGVWSPQCLLAQVGACQALSALRRASAGQVPCRGSGLASAGWLLAFCKPCRSFPLVPALGVSGGHSGAQGQSLWAHQAWGRILLAKQHCSRVRKVVQGHAHLLPSITREAAVRRLLSAVGSSAHPCPAPAQHMQAGLWLLSLAAAQLLPCAISRDTSLVLLLAARCLRAWKFPRCSLLCCSWNPALLHVGWLWQWALRARTGTGARAALGHGLVRWRCPVCPVCLLLWCAAQPHSRGLPLHLE